jgi:glycerol-3-phosphate dehydrogenase (NAD(P)+)
MTRAAVLGSGSWGTAFAIVLADAGTEVVLWGREQRVVDAIVATRQNPVYHPGVELPSSIEATTDPAKAVHDADIVALAIPSQTLRVNLAAWSALFPRAVVLVSLMKGVELGTCKRMSEVMREVVGVGSEQVAVVSGPNLAKEIAQREPAATVVACQDLAVAQRIQAACHTSYFRPYTETDVIGCELGGAVKNVIALAAGMAEGMGFGHNARASLITRGLAETARLGQALGADPLTFAGLAGLGDLVATCSSPLSRNRTFGENLGKGMTVAEVIAITKQTAEGVKSCSSILELARQHDVDMPITEHVVRVIHEGVSPPEVLSSLMSRDAKPEKR